MLGMGSVKMRRIRRSPNCTSAANNGWPVSRRAVRKAAINGVSTPSGTFTKNLCLRPKLGRFAPGSNRGLPEHSHLDTASWITALDFQSANPSIVKSIKQRDLLNTWLRLYARERLIPCIEEYQPSRFTEELTDLAHCTVDSTQAPPRLTIRRDGTRISSAFGNTGQGRYLDEYLGTRLAPMVMPVHYEAVRRGLPVYTISNIDDIYGRIVAYERLLLPFSSGSGITDVIVSLKTISEDGGFEIRNLMRGNDNLPTMKLCAVIDRDLFHRAPGRIPAGDVIEFD
jgi:hypothetical protein